MKHIQGFDTSWYRFCRDSCSTPDLNEQQNAWHRQEAFYTWNQKAPEDRLQQRCPFTRLNMRFAYLFFPEIALIFKVAPDKPAELTVNLISPAL